MYRWPQFADTGMNRVERPDPKFKHMPLEMTVFETEEMYNDLVEAMERTGWWGAVSIPLPLPTTACH